MKNPFLLRSTFLLMACLAISSISYAEDLKLQCELQISRAFISGQTEKETVNATVEITDLKEPKYLAIFVDAAEPLISVASRLRANVVKAMNWSDDSKWELQVETKEAEKYPNTTNSVRIDRNTGVLTFQRIFRGGELVTSGVGPCTKVNMALKKF